jgi:hypothetical protein
LISNPFASTPETPIKKIYNNENKGKELAIFSPFQATSHNLSTKAPRRLLRLSQNPNSSMYWYPVLHLRAQSADAEMRKGGFSFGLTSVDIRKRLPHPVLHWLSNMIMEPCPLGKGLSLVLGLRWGLVMEVRHMNMERFWVCFALSNGLSLLLRLRWGLVMEVRHMNMERFWVCFALGNGLSLILRLRWGLLVVEVGHMNMECLWFGFTLSKRLCLVLGRGLLVVEVGHMNMECLWFGFTLSKGLSLILRRGLLVVEVRHMNVERFWVCLALREGLSLVLRRGLLVVEVRHVNVEWFSLTLGEGLSLVLRRGLLVVEVRHVNVEWFSLALREGLSLVLRRGLLVVEVRHVNVEWFWISLALTIGVQDLLPILDDTRNIIGDTSTLASMVGNFIEVYAMLWLRVTLGKGLSLILGRGLLVVEVGHVNVKGFCFPLTVGVKNLLSILDDAGDIVSDAGTLTNTMSDVVNIHTVFWLRIASDFVFFVENWEVVDRMETLRFRSATPDRIASDFMNFVENWEVIDGTESLMGENRMIAGNFSIVDDWTMTLREPVDFLRSQLQIRTGGRMSFAVDFTAVT